MKNKEFSILEKRAKSGNVKAQYELGELHLSDDKYEGKYKDVENAVYWLVKSAEQGYTKQNMNLEICILPTTAKRLKNILIEKQLSLG